MHNTHEVQGYDAETKSSTLLRQMALQRQAGFTNRDMDQARRGLMVGSYEGPPNPASWIQGGTIHSTARQGADLSTMLERISQAIEHGFQRGQHQPPKTVQLMVSPESRYKAEIAEQSALNELHFVMVRAAG